MILTGLGGGMFGMIMYKVQMSFMHKWIIKLAINLNIMNNIKTAAQKRWGKLGKRTLEIN